MHKRLIPRINAFTYGIYYLVLPLSCLSQLPMPHNRFGLLSFYDKDHGARDGTSLQAWIKNILAQDNVTEADGEIYLITMPRVLGYVFNPVSFWLCHDKKGDLRAVLCEVNNTFGETHSYLCMYDDHRPITKMDCLEGDKYFHVSPFLEIKGHYSFRFNFEENSFSAWIDYQDESQRKKLLTALNGQLVPMDKNALHLAFWHYPLVTFWTVLLIHWQAIKLLWKGIRYVPKPPQKLERMTFVRKIKKM